MDAGATKSKIKGIDLCYRSLFDAAPNAYVVLDREFNIVGCNTAYLNVVGRSSGDSIIGRNMFEAFPSDPSSASYQLLKASLERTLTTKSPDYLALIPYDTSQPGQPPDMRFWSATHTPLLGEDGDVELILQHTEDVTELQRLKDRDTFSSVVGTGLLRRAEAAQNAKLEAHEETEFLRELFQQAPGFTAVLLGPEHRYSIVNTSYENLVGNRQLVGLSVAQALPEVVGQGFIEILDKVFNTGQPYIGVAELVSLNSGENEPPRQRLLDFVYQPITLTNGRVAGIFVQGQDVTEKVQAQRQQEALNRELAHRLKNSMAMVQGIATQTLRGRTSPDAFNAFKERLRVLSAAHDILLAKKWSDAPLLSTIKAIVSPYGEGGHIKVSGDDIDLASRAVLNVAMLMHELATNAIKHGSLSSPEGTVHVNSHIEGSDLVLRWVEEGGPPAVPPSHSGLGARLIGAGLLGTGGTVMNYQPEGFSAEFRANLRDISEASKRK